MLIGRWPFADSLWTGVEQRLAEAKTFLAQSDPISAEFDRDQVECLDSSALPLAAARRFIPLSMMAFSFPATSTAAMSVTPSSSVLRTAIPAMGTRTTPACHTWRASARRAPDCSTGGTVTDVLFRKSCARKCPQSRTPTDVVV